MYIYMYIYIYNHALCITFAEPNVVELLNRTQIINNEAASAQCGCWGAVFRVQKGGGGWSDAGEVFTLSVMKLIKKELPFKKTSLNMR
jgi:hypothetical protein